VLRVVERGAARFSLILPQICPRDAPRIIVLKERALPFVHDKCVMPEKSVYNVDTCHDAIPLHRRAAADMRKDTDAAASRRI